MLEKKLGLSQACLEYRAKQALLTTLVVWWSVIQHLHLESYTPGLWRYIPVHTFCNVRMAVHTGTFQHRQTTESTSLYKYVQVCTLLCLSQYMTVYGNTRNYRPVHTMSSLSLFTQVHGGTLQYIIGLDLRGWGGGGGGAAHFGAHLNVLHCMHI